MPIESRTSYGTHFLDHLAADGAGLTGGQVAVVAVLEVDAHLIGGLHLELVHGLTGLGDVQTVAGGVAAGVVAGVVGSVVGIVVAVAHDRSLLLSFGKRLAPRRNQIAFRGSILSRAAAVMIGDWRYVMKMMEMDFPLRQLRTDYRKSLNIRTEFHGKKIPLEYCRNLHWPRFE